MSIGERITELRKKADPGKIGSDNYAVIEKGSR